MTPPRLRLVQPDELLAPDDLVGPEGLYDPPDEPEPTTPEPATQVSSVAPTPSRVALAPGTHEPSAPVPTDRDDNPAAADSSDPSAPVPADSHPLSAPVPADSHPSAPVLADPLSDPTMLRLVSPSPVPEDRPPPAVIVAELDALLVTLARDAALDDPGCERLTALALQVPGRQRVVTAALGHLATPAAVVALRALPPSAPGVLDALLHCFTQGVTRTPVPETSADAPTLALDFRGSRARGFPDLVARAQAIAARSPAAEFDALDVDGRRHYRLSFCSGRGPAAALASQLRAAHLDLVWLHGRLARLRGTRLWLGGWRFDADDPLGPAIQAHLLQAWLRHAEQAP